MQCGHMLHTGTQAPCAPARQLPCRTNFSLKRDESTFVDWQKAKVQETADEVRVWHCTQCWLQAAVCSRAPAPGLIRWR